MKAPRRPPTCLRRLRGFRLDNAVLAQVALLAFLLVYLPLGRLTRRLNVDCHVSQALAGTAPTCPIWLDRHYPLLSHAEVEAALALGRDEHAGAGASARASARASAVWASSAGSPLPFCDILVVVPSPSSWTERRGDVRRQFRRSQRLIPRGSCAELLFIVGTRAYTDSCDHCKPAPPPDADQGDVLLVDCTDQDGPGGMWSPLRDSSTTCKLIAALVHAVATRRFHFLARVGDDSFFRVDTFLSRVAPHHILAGEDVAMGSWLPEDDFNNPARSLELGGPPGLAVSRSLPYPGGMGFVLSYKVVAALSAVEERVGLVDGAAEDIMVGVWLVALNRARVRRVHSPCFHNSAEWALDATSPAGRSQHNLAGTCTDSSLLVHYMNAPARLWDRIGDDGVLRDCGTTEAAAYCWLPPFSLLNAGKSWPGGPITPAFA